MKSSNESSCLGCASRREFLDRLSGTLLAGTLFTEIGAAEASAGQSASERAYAIPAKDGVSIDKGAQVILLTPQGERLEDDSFLLLFNASVEGVVFVLPPRRFGRRWTLELSTYDPNAEASLFPPRGLVPVDARTIVVLRSVD